MEVHLYPNLFLGSRQKGVGELLSLVRSPPTPQNTNTHESLKMSNVLVLSLLPQAQSVHRECSPVCSSCNLPCRVGANYCFLFMSVGKKNKQTTKTSHVRLVNKRISGKSGEETHSHCSSFPMASPKTNL